MGIGRNNNDDDDNHLLSKPTFACSFTILSKPSESLHTKNNIELQRASEMAPFQTSTHKLHNRQQNSQLPAPVHKKMGGMENVDCQTLESPFLAASWSDVVETTVAP
jgi:hypothetical protein